MSIHDDKEKHRSGNNERLMKRQYKEALAHIITLERELEGFRSITTPPSKRIIKRAVGSVNRAQATAFAVASDWHIEEIVKPSTVQGKNKYNPDIATERADKFWRKIVSLTVRNRSDTLVENLVLILNGDFISSNIHEELLENTALRPMEAILMAQDLIDSGIRYLKEHGGFKHITVVCKSGNHSRINHKIRHATREGNSLEWAMYHNLARHHTDLKWVIEESYLTYLTVYDKVIRIHHGDAIRYMGGVGGLTIPMTRAYYQWNMTEPADINIMGHWHQYTPGYNIVNGSLIGWNAYAAQNRFAYQPPIQSYFLLDPQRGITVHSPILV